MGYRCSGNVWIDNFDGTAESFIGFVLLFSDKKTTTLKNTALGAYSVHDFLLNVSARKF